MSAMRLLYLFLVCLISCQVKGQTFENNGYRDLVVSIHPDVSATNQEEIVNNIKVSLHSQKYYSGDLFTKRPKITYSS